MRQWGVIMDNFKNSQTIPGALLLLQVTRTNDKKELS